MFLMLILMVPVVFAGINLEGDIKDTYYLGEIISPSFQLSLDTSQEVLFKLELDCDGYNLDYFVVLLDLAPGESVKVAPPDLKLNENMEGECKLNVYLDSLDKKRVDEFSSSEFDVRNDIEVILSADKKNVLPGEIVNLNGVLSKVGSSLTIAFNGKQEFIDISEEIFSFGLKIPENIKSGEYLLFVDVKDDDGNIGDANLGINVLSLASSIDFNVNGNVFKPGDLIIITPNVYDQAGDILDNDVLVSIDDLFSGTIQSGNQIEYILDNYTAPGSYSLTALYESFSATDVIVVQEMKLIDVNMEGEIVYIKNIGNVKYDDVAELNLYGADKNYFLSKEIVLDVAESMQIDLSKEVPTDNYNIDLAVQDEVFSVGENISVEDKRTIFGKITGAAVVDGGLISKNPLVASIFLLLIIAGITVFYIKKNKKEKQPF